MVGEQIEIYKFRWDTWCVWLIIIIIIQDIDGIITIGSLVSFQYKVRIEFIIIAAEDEVDAGVNPLITEICQNKIIMAHLGRWYRNYSAMAHLGSGRKIK